MRSMAGSFATLWEAMKMLEKVIEEPLTAPMASSLATQ